MHQTPGPQRSLVLSYLQLRMAIGVIGFTLPFVLALGQMLSPDPRIQCSVSDYYYTNMGNWFVGSLCAIGVFLGSYRGYDRRDQLAGWFACVCAIGVAQIKAAPCTGATDHQKLVGELHWTCAALLFLTLAYFSLFLFTETDSPGNETRRKLKRNVVYRVCGVVMLACLAFIAAVRWTPLHSLAGWEDADFWLESTAIIAFGVSWLVKGEMILKDQEA